VTKPLISLRPAIATIEGSRFVSCVIHVDLPGLLISADARCAVGSFRNSMDQQDVRSLTFRRASSALISDQYSLENLGDRIRRHIGHEIMFTMR
jgi:hypothetical protein